MDKIKLNKRTEKYDPKEFWMLSGGPGGIYLVDQLAEKLDLQKGQRLLDIGPGHLVSSIFLAKEYDVIIYAYDLWVNANDMYEIIKKYKLENKIIPISADINNIPFPDNYFDKMFAMGSFSYFGLKKEFGKFISKYLKKSGLLGIADGCRNINSIEKVRNYYHLIRGSEELPLYNHYIDLLTSENIFKLKYNEHAEYGFELWYEYFKKTYEIKLQPPWGNDNYEIVKLFENDNEKMLSNQITIVEKN